MSTVAFRQQLAAVMVQAQADWTGAPFDMEYENRTQINPDSQTRPFVLFDLYYLGGEQKDLSDQPLVGTNGQLYLSIAVKPGDGTAYAEALRDFLSPRFELKLWPSGHTGAAEPLKDKPLNGWVYYPLLFNFTIYRHTTL